MKNQHSKIEKLKELTFCIKELSIVLLDAGEDGHLAGKAVGDAGSHTILENVKVKSRKCSSKAQIKIDPTYPLRGALHLHLVHPLPLHHPVDPQHATNLLITVVPSIHLPHRAEVGPEGRGVETKPYKNKTFGIRVRHEKILTSKTVAITSV